MNGKIADPGMRVNDLDKITVEDKPVGHREKKVVLAYYKPVGVTCTEKDKHAQITIRDVVEYPVRVTYAGRLDRDSEGLLLLTNDGDLINGLMRAANFHEKEYLVRVNKPISRDFLKKMSDGMLLKDLNERTRPCFVKEEGKFVFRIILTQGLNRQIRRMCRALDYHVMNLKRVRIMNLQLGTLKRGEYRELTEKELGDLMRMVEGSTNLPAREAAKLGKIVDPAKRERKPGSSGHQGKPGGRKPSDKNNEGKPFEKKTGTGKIWRNVRQDGEIKPEKKAPASPESWKPGAPERKEHKIWTTRSRG